MPKISDNMPYPKLEVVACVHDPKTVAEGTQTAPALTEARVKELLGWEVIPPGAGKDAVPLLTDAEGNEVRCLHITRNRPFDVQHAYNLAQEHLQKRFAPKGPNGETWIIGKSGEVLSAQHRGVGFLLACQMRRGPQADHWKKNWSGELTMETFIVFGADESPETIRTLDNVRPRTFADVLFSEGSAFKKGKKHSEREALCRVMQYALKELWSRTGMNADAFTSYLSHSEALDFLRRHPKLTDAVNHVWTENKRAENEQAPKGEARGKLEKYIGLGVAAAMMYLMGHAASNRDRWREAKVPSEKQLDSSLWSKAEDFFALLASGAPELQAVVNAKRKGTSDYIFVRGETGGTQQERRAVIVKAWDAFKEDKKITQTTVSLKYVDDGEGGQRLDEFPVIGGIDVGPQKKPKPAESQEAQKIASGEAHAQVEEEARKVKEEALAATRDKPKKGNKKNPNLPPVNLADTSDVGGEDRSEEDLFDGFDSARGADEEEDGEETRAIAGH